MKEKRFPIYLPLLMIVIVVFLCKDDLQSKESEIAAYILNNQEILTHMASAALTSGIDTVKLIDGVNSIDCWNDADCVEFKYYSIGLGNALGTHYGFYYSTEDMPAAYGGQNVNLITSENGWFWSGEDDSSGFTKKLMDNWYYYETSF